MHTQSYTPKSHKTTSKQSWKSKLTNLLAQSILMQDGIVASSAAAHWLVLSSPPAISNTSTPQCHRFSLSDATACPCSNWRTETGSMIWDDMAMVKTMVKTLGSWQSQQFSLPETDQVVPFLVFQSCRDGIINSCSAMDVGQNGRPLRGPQIEMSSLVLTIHNFGVPNFDPYPND